MSSKPILFTGIVLLVLGILIRNMTSFGNFGLFLILFGVALKAAYIVSKARTGAYDPGIELGFLFVGLFLFLTGLYCRSTDETLIYPIYLMASGLILKIIFIIRFIQLTRSP